MTTSRLDWTLFVVSALLLAHCDTARAQNGAGLVATPQQIYNDAQARAANASAIAAAQAADVAQSQTALTAATANLATTAQLAAQNIQLAGTYTIATLPGAAANPNMRAIVTDLGGGQGIVAADALNGCWRDLSPYSRYQTLTADQNGSLAYLSNADVVLATGGITTPRTWALSTTNACKGAVLRVVRAFVPGDTNPLTIGGINLQNGATADFHFDGSAWQPGGLTTNRQAWGQTCTLTTTTRNGQTVAVGNVPYSQAFPTGTVPLAQCTVQAPAGASALYNCQIDGPPTAASAGVVVNTIPSSSISLVGLTNVTLFQAAPATTCVTVTARQPG